MVCYEHIDCEAKNLSISRDSHGDVAVHDLTLRAAMFLEAF
jgi:hypothetical protein